jgi:hypothetical protein
MSSKPVKGAAPKSLLYFERFVVFIPCLHSLLSCRQPAQSAGMTRKGWRRWPWRAWHPINLAGNKRSFVMPSPALSCPVMPCDALWCPVMPFGILWTEHAWASYNHIYIYLCPFRNITWEGNLSFKAICMMFCLSFIVKHFQMNHFSSWLHRSNWPKWQAAIHRNATTQWDPRKAESSEQSPLADSDMARTWLGHDSDTCILQTTETAKRLPRDCQETAKGCKQIRSS